MSLTTVFKSSNVQLEEFASEESYLEFHSYPRPALYNTTFHEDMNLDFNRVAIVPRGP
jgi:hypothetical protein